MRSRSLLTFFAVAALCAAAAVGLWFISNHQDANELSSPIVCSSTHASLECSRPVGRVDTSPLGFTYQYFDQFAAPIRWKTCSQIPYWINPGSSTPDQQNAVHRAFATASDTTGVLFTYQGHTTSMPLSGGQQPRAGVVVAFTNESVIPFLAGRVAALTDVWWEAAERKGSPGEIFAAGIVIDEHTSIIPESGRGSWEVVALHEIGHVLNLGHSQEHASVMRGLLNRDISPEFPQGDAAGLRLLYRPNSCPVGAAPSNPKG